MPLGLKIVIFKFLLPILKINVHGKLYLKYVTFWGDVNKSKSQPLVVQHTTANQF